MSCVGDIFRIPFSNSMAKAKFKAISFNPLRSKVLADDTFDSVAKTTFPKRKRHALDVITIRSIL